jgi:hypothetical protein
MREDLYMFIAPHRFWIVRAARYGRRLGLEGATEYARAGTKAARKMKPVEY